MLTKEERKRQMEYLPPPEEALHMIIEIKKIMTEHHDWEDDELINEITNVFLQHHVCTGMIQNEFWDAEKEDYVE